MYLSDTNGNWLNIIDCGYNDFDPKWINDAGQIVGIDGTKKTYFLYGNGSFSTIKDLSLSVGVESPFESV